MSASSPPTIPHDLLRRVSRSFALTLDFLPREVREPISLAYLLARLSDTEADGAASASERELLNRKSDIEALLPLSPDREAIERVWTTIREGQAWDSHRFPSHDAPPLSSKELNRYTYLVAGCVGEFWTRVCAEKLPGFASRPIEEMIRLGISYGQGLQLVNILRDRHADLARGRVYVPPSHLEETFDAAHEHLQSGCLYSRALRPWRLRAATALPYLLGIKTLARTAQSPAKPRAKVGKSALWWCVAQALMFRHQASE